MGGCRCTYKTCGSTSKTHRNLHFFHYPVKSRDRCLHWIRSAEKPHFAYLECSQLRNRVICELHFEDNCFTNKSRSRLIHNALPTLYRQPISEPLHYTFVGGNLPGIKQISADGNTFTLDTESYRMQDNQVKMMNYNFQDGNLVPSGGEDHAVNRAETACNGVIKYVKTEALQKDVGMLNVSGHNQQLGLFEDHFKTESDPGTSGIYLERSVDEMDGQDDESQDGIDSHEVKYEENNQNDELENADVELDVEPSNSGLQRELSNISFEANEDNIFIDEDLTLDNLVVNEEMDDDDDEEEQIFVYPTDTEEDEEDITGDDKTDNETTDVPTMFSDGEQSMPTPKVEGLVSLRPSLQSQIHQQHQLGNPNPTQNSTLECQAMPKDKNKPLVDARVRVVRAHIRKIIAGPGVKVPKKRAAIKPPLSDSDREYTLECLREALPSALYHALAIYMRRSTQLDDEEMDSMATFYTSAPDAYQLMRNEMGCDRLPDENMLKEYLEAKNTAAHVDSAHLRLRIRQSVHSERN